jgi:3-hydroxymyristoyl/3-hydroxydecanoyl-(acyl carrier protein) dehydratase
MLAEIRMARFRDWVRPDEEVVIRAEVTQDRPEYAMARCRLEVAGKKVGSADLMFAFLPYDRFGPGYRDEVLEAYLAGEAGER